MGCLFTYLCHVCVLNMSCDLIVQCNPTTLARRSVSKLLRKRFYFCFAVQFSVHALFVPALFEYLRQLAFLLTLCFAMLQLQQLLASCSCSPALVAHKLRDGKYMLNGRTVFVRLLKSHVMVRVGGGWSTLAEYLAKHDPCRLVHVQRPHSSYAVPRGKVRLHRVSNSAPRSGRKTVASTLKPS